VDQLGAAQEFIARFLRHVLPPGFKRIRHYGLLAPGHKRQRLAAARAALQTPEPQAMIIESAAPAPAYNPHSDRHTGGSVQRGLSAAPAAAA
jgi:hypothetical protein